MHASRCDPETSADTDALQDDSQPASRAASVQDDEQKKPQDDFSAGLVVQPGGVETWSATAAAVTGTTKQSETW